MPPELPPGFVLDQPATSGPVYGPPPVVDQPSPVEMENLRLAQEDNDLARQQFLYQQQRDAAKDADPSASNPDRVPQIENILGLIQELRGAADDTLAVGRMSRSISETPIIGSLFGQNRANVEGFLPTIEGDLIQQQIARLNQMNGGNGVSSLANSETEARRMASAIANLDPNQEYGQFVAGIQRAEDYYQREYERLTGRRYVVDTERTDEQDQRDQQPEGTGGTTGQDRNLETNGGGFDPDPNGGTDPNGTPLRLLNGDILLGYERNENGSLYPQYGQPQPTREGISALILGDGTRSFGEQLGAGVGDIVQAGGDILGMVGNPLNQGINAVLGTNLSTDLGGTARDISGLPDNPNQLQSSINRGAASAMMFGGGANSLSSLVTNPVARGTLTTIGQSPIRDAAAGAAAGAGAYAGQDLGPIGQTATALGAGALGYGLAGLLPGSRAAVPAAANTTRQGLADIVATGDREGVRVMTSDVSPPQNFVSRTVQATGERIPYAGTGGPRMEQQAQREQVVRNIAQEYGVTGSDDFVAAVSADLARTRGRQLTGLTNRKNRIIDGTPGQVNTPLAVAEIDNQIANLQRNFEPEQINPVINQLQVFRRALTSGRDLRGIEEQRRLVGDAFTAPELSSVRSAGEKALSAVYAPLREDMTTFIRDKAGPEVAERFTDTNNRLSAMVGELEASNFSRALSQADLTPETAANLLFSRNESDVRRLASNLSPRGRQAAQSAIIYRAIESAGGLDAVTGLSPQQFANAISRYSDNIGVVFEPRDAQRLEGVQRLLQATQRASVAAAAPPTGVQNNLPILTAILADMMGGAGAGLTTAGVGGLMARLYESAPVRDRLVALSRTQPGSSGETGIVESIARIMASQPALRESLAGVANDNATLPANVAASPDDEQQQ